MSIKNKLVVVALVALGSVSAALAQSGGDLNRGQPMHTGGGMGHAGGGAGSGMSGLDAGAAGHGSIRRGADGGVGR